MWCARHEHPLLSRLLEPVFEKWKEVAVLKVANKIWYHQKAKATMCYPSFNWLNPCLTGRQTLRHFGENDTFRAKAGCKFLVASSFSAQFTPLARPNYKHGWPPTASEAERQSICSKKRTWCCYRRWHYHLVVVNQWQNSGSLPKSRYWWYIVEIWTVSFFSFFRFFAHGKMVFALLKVLERNLIGKAPPSRPTSYNLHLDCKSWQNLDKHLCLYTVWPEFVFRSSAF